VVNPAATTTSARTREVLASALEADLKLEVAHTRHRGHAAELARQARDDGLDLVVVLGGDGTVNEVVNGLLCDGPYPDVPALAVVPGGGTNVFSRALGVPRDPVEATGALLDALRDHRRRSIGLGIAGTRWFTFNAGMGWDADVVASVERDRAKGLEASPARYARTALRHYLRQYRRPTKLTVELPGREPVEDVRLFLVCNTDPWTYLGSRPVRTNPGCGQTDGLALFALLHLGPTTIVPILREMLRKEGNPDGPKILRDDELPLIRVSSSTPVALQVDGDYLGERSEMEFIAVPSALRVVV
jgi:diacylglycerol kinase family enzyme